MIDNDAEAAQWHAVKVLRRKERCHEVRLLVTKIFFNETVLL